MRVMRLIILLSAVAVIAAGCVTQPANYAAAPDPGIDSFTYGTAAAMPPPAPAATVADHAAGRGLFATFAYAPAPAVLAAAEPPPVPSIDPAPVVTTPPPLFAAATTEAVVQPAVRQGPYTLDAGDRLRIVVFGQDGLTNAYLVDASGHIAMPLIGTVLARGDTTDQLAAKVAAKLKDGFIRDPHVAVEVEAYRPFFILGEVTAPGQYPYVANMTVETAIAIAGGFGPRAYRRTVVVNRNTEGQQVRMTVPLSYALRPGDTINVQERWF
jgi:polysaccharide export outer membrane protein